MKNNFIYKEWLSMLLCDDKPFSSFKIIDIIQDSTDNNQYNIRIKYTDIIANNEILSHNSDKDNEWTYEKYLSNLRYFISLTTKK